MEKKNNEDQTVLDIVEAIDSFIKVFGKEKMEESVKEVNSILKKKFKVEDYNDCVNFRIVMHKDMFEKLKLVAKENEMDFVQYLYEIISESIND
jgi:hypothetical protein